MKVPNSEHRSRPWRIHEIAPEFRLLDVWALPVEGTAEDFEDLLALVASADPANLQSLSGRLLWQIRDRLGSWFDLGRISTPPEVVRGGAGLTIPGTNQTSLADRLPDDLRNSVGGLRFAALPFVPLYRTDVEFAAELSNKTVHGLMHLGWVERAGGRFSGEMAVYVQPRGRLGAYYLRAIEPFRRFIVYPALMRQIASTWATRHSASKVIS